MPMLPDFNPDLNDDIQYVKGVGPSLSLKLNNLGIYTAGDLLYHFPRAYEDRRTLKLLRNVKEGERATFRFKVIEHATFHFKGKIHPKIKVSDDSGNAWLYCFNRQFLTDILKVGKIFYLTGIFMRKYNIPAFSQFDYDLNETAPELRILPIYRLTAGVSQKMLRRLTQCVIERYSTYIEEDTPGFITRGYKLGRKGELIKEIHFPEDMHSLRRAKEAFSYQEFFKYQILAALARNRNKKIKKVRKTFSGKLKKDFLSRIRFELTNAQKRVLKEIEEDLHEQRPMNRLIQGDVGSGKTVVALIALLDVIEAGGQAAIMAPTEILARQHFYTVCGYLEGLSIQAEFISGSVRDETRKEFVSRLSSGEIDIAVGTHALFSEDICFKDLSFAIIDEQHKFGVLQRGSLRAKGKNTDCIVMSATPIPRTLSMTLYGDLDVSIIDEMPEGRGGVTTYIVKQAHITKVYDKVKEEVKKGRQAYFIYPIIEESKTTDMKNALDSYERLKKVFMDFNVGLLHGRMNEEEKTSSMNRFKDRECDILVATSVVEVGVDITNATVMVIEQAERFGLSSIHQLRGRIGRGSYESFCFLVPDRSTGRDAYDRLRILRDTQDGFKIAEWDLRMRGPGEILGKKQSGIPSFMIDDFNINSKLIYRAQRDARRLVSGEIGSKEERNSFLTDFMKSDFYKKSVLYFGG